MSSGQVKFSLITYQQSSKNVQQYNQLRDCVDFVHMMSTTIQNKSNNEEANVENASEESYIIINAIATEPKQDKNTRKKNDTQ